MNPTLVFALACAEKGWHVFPVKYGEKKPATPNGFKDAVTDRTQIEAWFMHERNLGIATGASGLVVIDVDNDKLTDASHQFLKSLPSTYRVKSGRKAGGSHHYYLAPRGLTIKNSAGDIVPGVDVRAEGGYVVGPTSMHPDGNLYVVEDERELAELPMWLAQQLKQTAAVTTVERPDPTQDGMPTSALSKRAQHFLLFGAIPGKWNSELYFTARDWQQNHGEYATFLEKAEKLSEEHEGALNEADMATINSAFKKAPSFPPRDVVVSTNNPFELFDELPTKQHGGKTHFPTEPMVFHWMSKSGAGYHYPTDSIQLYNNWLGMEEVYGRLVCDANNVPVPLDREVAKHAIEDWKRQERAKALEECKKSLTHQGGDAEALAKQYALALNPEATDLDIAAILHFVWQVKRKLFGLPVTDHMMLVLFGAQGKGKSTAVRKLCEPAAMLMRDLADFKVLEDDRQLKILNTAHILLNEEMARMNSADIALVKTHMTSETTTQRQMRQTSHSTYRNNATFIGCANVPLLDLIYDVTGVRRFWQLDCPTLNWDAINAFDAAALWRAVDESKPSPLGAHKSEIAAYQNEHLRNKDSVELFFEDWCTIPETPTEASWFPAAELFARYQAYCVSNGITSPFTSTRFGRRFKTFGVEHRKSNGMKYLVNVKAS